MIEDIFYDCLCHMDIFEKEDFEKNVTYSRWCTGERPIPKEISRCNVSQYESVKVSEMDADTELVELFYKHCPSAKGYKDIVREIIQTVGCHTLTVCLSALSLTASGIEPKDLRAEYCLRGGCGNI